MGVEEKLNPMDWVLHPLKFESGDELKFSGSRDRYLRQVCMPLTILLAHITGGESDEPAQVQWQLALGESRSVGQRRRKDR